jgi:predicted enzyme related to lactoylglutathione lyase
LRMTKQISSSLTALMVSDLERSKQFYREVLGFDVTDWWAVRDGLQGIALKLLQAPTPEAVNPNPPENEWTRAFDLYAYTEDWTSLDSLYEEFRSKGAVISGEPVILPDFGPWKEFIVQDPDGYHIAFGGTDGRKANSYVQDHIEAVFLSVHDLESSKKLYAAFLGLDIREQDRCGDQHPFIFSNGTKMILDGSGNPQDKSLREAGPVLFTLSSPHLESAYSHAQDLGFQVVVGITHHAHASYFTIRDGDGNTINVSRSHT